MPSIKRPLVVVTAAVVVGYLLLIAVESRHRPLMRGRWIVDYYDVEIYFERAQFLPLRAMPYRDVFSEYPPLATLAFTAGSRSARQIIGSSGMVGEVQMV